MMGDVAIRQMRGLRSSEQGRPSRSEFIVFVCVPFVFTLGALMIFRSTHLFAVNFHNEFWPAGRRVLHGVSPYLLGRGDIATGRAFPYPGVAAVLFAPLALVPRVAGDVMFTGACVLAAPVTLWVLGARDRRLYGIVFLWAPVMTAWQTANLSLLLCLGLALLWRHRDRPAIAGLVAALMVSLKPFVWPVGLWLVATRRYRATGWALVIGVAINAFAWGLLGFGEIHRYLLDASKVSSYFYRHAYTVVALGLHLGLGRTGATALAAAVCVAAGVACAVAGRRGEEVRALALCVALTLFATPVQWMHYLVLVLVPLALARPRMGRLWWLPVALLAGSSSSPVAWQIAFGLGTAGLVLGLIVRRPAAEPAGARERATSPAAAAGTIGATSAA
jgi:hypothetical protein